MARYVLDIFLSSTSEDLREYRDTVTEVLGRLGQFTVRMESFGAKPNKPFAACREEVAGCDALIVLVGHRYGWIPPKPEGDDEKSITWWEVYWALEAGKPVYAFLVDPKAPWTGAREQDTLLAATTEAQSLATWRAVQQLKAFRSFLESETTRALFKNADQLGSLVATSLFPWLLQHAGPHRSSTPSDQVASPVIPPDREGAAPASSLKPGGNYWSEQIHAASARELIATPEPVRVAIVAGHPRVSHPALKGISIISVPAADDMAAGSTADDYTTGLAALIGAGGAGGFTGVAPGVELLALGTLNEDLSATQVTIAKAIDRAVVGGARVLCLALGAPERSEILSEAIREAVEAGVTIVVAGGNDGSATLGNPASHPSVIAAGAVDARGRPTSWTNHGNGIHVTAPGENLWLPAGEDGYAQSSGTSWAAAIATGLAALLLQAQPALTPAQIKEHLIATGDRAATPRGKTIGPIVNAYYAVKAVAP